MVIKNYISDTSMTFYRSLSMISGAHGHLQYGGQHKELELVSLEACTERQQSPGSIVDGTYSMCLYFV